MPNCGPSQHHLKVSVNARHPLPTYFGILPTRTSIEKADLVTKYVLPKFVFLFLLGSAREVAFNGHRSHGSFRFKQERWRPRKEQNVLVLVQVQKLKNWVGARETRWTLWRWWQEFKQERERERTCRSTAKAKFGSVKSFVRLQGH